MNRDFHSDTGGEMNDQDIAMQPCAEWQPLLILLAAGDELDPADDARLATHLQSCSECSVTLAREEEILALLAEHRNEPDAALLAECRASVEDVLDREEEGGWLRRSLGLLVPSSWLSPRPAWSAAVLLVIGFSVGVLAPRLFRHPASPAAPGNSSASNLASSAAIPGTTSNEAPASPVPTSLDLHSADVAGISVFPSGGEGPARVELQLRAQQPVTVQGTVDDDDVKEVLLDILGKGDRICPDIRLDAVECLRSRSSDPEVRSALCHAVRGDHNAAVRLKALEALNGAGSQEMVRQTLLDALVSDQNPGVRVEAVNALRNMAAKGDVPSDDHTLSVLRDRMQKDPNTYIRLQSAAAIGDLGTRAKF